jgi:beta-glucosidase
VARTLGGGSATVFPPYTVSPLDGIRGALGTDVRVEHAVGVRAHTRISIADPALLRLPEGSGEGVVVRFIGADGTVLGSEQRRSGAFNWMGSFTRDLPIDQVTTVEVQTRLHATEAGDYTVGCAGIGHFTLDIGDHRAFDTELSLPPGVDPVEGLMRPPQQ